jgi:hypothetical protein
MEATEQTVFDSVNSVSELCDTKVQNAVFLRACWSDSFSNQST